ncbi:chromate transporter [Marinobacter sp. BSs20148]|jgi:chromate transport protein ChrA|uniref:chromate transporter n=1 Tax=Marinobacter sp. BSs20148 TaxID=490759 RepID=UPI0005A017FD|nr:chromate transporter [Marinobacter sp. BSs20148]
MTCEPTKSTITEKLEPANYGQVSLIELAVVLFRIGATSFGGMWAGTQKLEKELVHNKGWLTVEEQKALMVAATLIPAPKFLAFGGMVGFRLRKWPGSIVALLSIFAPPALFVLTGAIFLNPEQLGGPMPTLNRAVGIGVIGLLFGNALHQIRNSRVPSRERIIGIVLGVSVASAAIAGVPLIFAALAGLLIGICLIRRGKEVSK